MAVIKGELQAPHEANFVCRKQQSGKQLEWSEFIEPESCEGSLRMRYCTQPAARWVDPTSTSTWNSMMQFLKDLSFRFGIDVAALHRVNDGRQTIEQRLRLEAERLVLQARALTGRRAGSDRLVMGLAANYGVAELAPFVLSLRGAGYDGDIALLTYGCSDETAAFMRRHRVRMLPFTSLSAMPMSMNSARMFRYLDWLIELYLNADDAPDYGRVLLTDVRDVVFQGDPFSRVADARLSFFLETGRTLATCPINRDWLRRAYGETAVAELGHHRVSCAGTLMGCPDGLLEYLAHMVRAIVDVPPEHRFSGVDQAIHNVILARGLVQGSVAVENGGPVMTVPTAENTGLRLLSDGRIANPDGSFSDTVHQYDRDPAVKRAIELRYAI